MNGGRIASIVVTTLTLLSVLSISVPETASAYTVRAPIYIDGDDDFTPLNGVTGGSGTPSDPYIIEGWDIDAGEEDGIAVLNADSHFVIRNVYVHDATTIINTTIFIMYASNATVKDSVFERCRSSGIAVAESPSAVVENNTIAECRTAVWLWYSNGVTVSSNRISNCTYGTYSFHSNSSTISSNAILNCTENAVIFEGAENSTAVGNFIRDSEYGIQLTESADCDIEGNSLVNHSYGINAESSNRMNASDNSIENCSRGIWVFESEWGSITGNSIGWPVGTGIVLHSSSNATASHNTIRSSSKGVHLMSCRDCVIAYNEITGGIYGITSWFSGLPGSSSSKGCEIVGNTVTETWDVGIRDVGSSSVSLGNNISMNHVRDNAGIGISVSGHDDVLYYNNISNNGGKSTEDK